MLFRFCSFSSFLPRWFWGWLSWCFGFGFGVGVGCLLLSLSVFLPLFVLFGVWLLAFLLVRRLFFVRFSRPRLGRFRFSLWRWFCVPASSLSAVRASCPVWFVRPAVVCRRSGAVLSFWVLACPLFADSETNCEPTTLKPPYGGESGGIAAAVAAVSLNLYQEVNTMRNYKEAYISQLIAKRAKEKAERRGGTFANEGATRGTVPFTEWLYYTEGIVRWTELSRYQLWNYYLEYRVDCVRNGMMFQCGEIYGLTNV